MKRFFALLLCMLMCLSLLPMTAFADDWTVSFNANGHGSAPESLTVADGEYASEPTAPTEVGWRFKGWYTEAACTNKFIFAETAITGNITLYANWKQIFTVSFNANGHGSAPDPLTVADGDKAAEPTAPTEDGWTFKGWYTEAACTNKFDFESDTIIANTTLYANWKQNFTVSFNANGHGIAPNQQIVVDGDKAQKPTDPTEDGWTFKGWCREAACTNKFDFESDTITGNTTLYANWKQNFTVTFNANEHGEAPDSQTVADGDKAQKPTDPTADGWTFKGWYREAACTNKFDFESDTITGNTTLYAKWKQNFTVSFNSNGHGTAPDSQTVADGDKAQKPTDPTADGWTFKDWYTEATCTNKYSFASTAITQNIELFALWKQNYTVSFNSNGHGTAPDSQTVPDGDKAHEPTAPTADGWTFKGWYREAACTNKFNFASTAITGNTKLYAKWERLYNIEVSPKPTHGTVSADEDAAEEGEIVYLNIEPDVDYVLSSLKVKNNNTQKSVTVKDNHFTMPASDVTVSATFKKIKIIDGDGGTAHYGSAYSFTVNTDLIDIERVWLEDYGYVPEKQYEVKKTNGQTIVTLKRAFISAYNLSEGKHYIDIETDFGITSGSFWVSKSPKTGDDSNVALWATVGVISAAGVAGIAYYLLKKRKK